MRRPSVLLVDDDETIAAGLTALLDDEEVDLHWHSSIITLPMAVGRTRPDLILLDLGLPGLSGASLLEAGPQRILRSDVPIVLFSGRPRHELSELAEQYGIAGFLSKEDDAMNTVRGIQHLLRNAATMKGDRDAATAASSLTA